MSKVNQAQMMPHVVLDETETFKCIVLCISVNIDFSVTQKTKQTTTKKYNLDLIWVP